MPNLTMGRSRLKIIDLNDCTCDPPPTLLKKQKCFVFGGGTFKGDESTFFENYYLVGNSETTGYSNAEGRKPPTRSKRTFFEGRYMFRRKTE